MKRSQRLLSLCLGLALAIGVSACNDVEDEVKDDTTKGDDTSEIVPSEPVTTYSVEITDSPSSLEVGKSYTIGVRLCTIVDDTASYAAGDSSSVILSSSDETIVSVSGLTVTAGAVGDVTITATWTEHNVTSEGISIKVTESVITPEPDTITYKVEITSPTSEIEINTATEVKVNLITITNGVEGEPVSATSSDVTITESGTSILKIEDLTITGLVEGEATIVATWKDHTEATDSVTITIKNSNPGGGEGEDVTLYGVSITNPASATVLKVNESLNVEASLITYTNGSAASTDAAKYGDVELTQSGSGSVTFGTDSLTITGATAGDVTLTVTWTGHESVTGGTASASVTFTVESVYTYKAVITSPTSGTELEVGETTDVVVLLYTTIDGVEQSPVTAGTNDITLGQSGTGSVTFGTDSLTVTGATAGEVTISATWIGHEDVKIESVTIAVTEPVVEEDSYTFSVKLIDSDSNDFSEPGSTYALFINTDYDAEANAGWNTYQMTYDSSAKTYSYKFDVLQTSGSYSIAVYAGYASSTEPNWSRKIGDSITITPTGSESGAVIADTVTLTPVFASFTAMFTSTTFIVTIGSLGVADTTRIHLYAAGDFDNWGEPIELTAGTSTYTLSLDFAPATGSSFEVIGYDSDSESYNDVWSHDNIATYTFTESDISSALGGSAVSITATTTYSSWSEIFTGLTTGGDTGEQGGGGSGSFVSYTITVALYGSDGTTLFPVISDDSAYGVYINSGFDTGGDNSTWSNYKMTNNKDGTYSYTYSSLPDAGTYSVDIYAGDTDGVSWSHQLGERFAVSVSGNETGEYQAENPYKITITTGTDWEDLFALGDDGTFYIVLLDNSGRSSWSSSDTISMTCEDEKNVVKDYFGEKTSCTATQTKTSTSLIAFYSEAASGPEGDDFWCDITVSSNSNSHLSTKTTTIPSNTSGTPVYICYAWMSDDWLKASSSTWWDATAYDNGWHYMPSGTTISDYVASLTITIQQ